MLLVEKPLLRLWSAVGREAKTKIVYRYAVFPKECNSREIKPSEEGLRINYQIFKMVNNKQ